MSENKPMTVTVTREIPLPWFTLTTADGQTEDMDPDQIREWFSGIGADMYRIDKALDYVWNFGSYRPATITIENPVDRRKIKHGVVPNI
jgi:hypothetical protein